MTDIEKELQELYEEMIAIKQTELEAAKQDYKNGIQRESNFSKVVAASNEISEIQAKLSRVNAK